MVVYGLIGATILFTVAGQLLLKAGMLEVGKLPADLNAIPLFLFNAFLNLKVLAGLLLAVVAAVAWMATLSITEISFAYPFMALAIVLVLALSGVLFDEQVSYMRWLGVAIVCFGLIFVARS